MHTVLGSVDSIIKPEHLVPWARERHLDAICITEHGNAKPPEVKELAQKLNFPIFTGLEASTEMGDLLLFGIDGYPRSLYKALDIINYVTAAGGVVIAAHPFRWDLSPKPWLGPRHNGLTVEKACEWPIFKLVHTMEVINGWATQEDVDFCFQVSRRLGMVGTGGSDAHTPEGIGRCVTIFEDGVETEAALVSALKGGRYWAEDRRQPNEKRSA